MKKGQHISKEGIEKEYQFLLQNFFEQFSKGAFEYEDVNTPYDLRSLPQDLQEGNTELYYESVSYFNRRIVDALLIAGKSMRPEKVCKAAAILNVLEDISFLLEKHMLYLYTPKSRKVILWKQ